MKQAAYIRFLPDPFDGRRWQKGKAKIGADYGGYLPSVLLYLLFPQGKRGDERDVKMFFCGHGGLFSFLRDGIGLLPLSYCCRGK
jgi:hypothetical protein